ncbi:hypothetical protein M427DRAFT_66345 [Gonapodya prolifera JEL478]|uniref:Uncharacterized protein n=1 Tax=Gonapodya prolifera (strain JEL478) TaxID=1344416 RepID=A0A139AWC1_GONPJ|nr:hypothetical protein M427DRAFT_66345 [Gonapodya prolifera JEL478]|eukprot:KXS21004.1 hypothetical protein M427DRAFT_66345 [Gonapodya prolifera JEL478]
MNASDRNPRDRSSGAQSSRRDPSKLSPPSIPTRFQTFVVARDSPKGFNSSVRRFETPEYQGDALAGPGYYHPQTTQNASSAKPSEKSHDPSFVSKSHRFVPTPSPALRGAPGPGSYEVAHDPRWSYFLQRKGNRVFAGRVVSGGKEAERGDAVLGMDTNKKSTPGPGEYDVGNEPPQQSLKLKEFRRKQKEIAERRHAFKTALVAEETGHAVHQHHHGPKAVAQ